MLIRIPQAIPAATAGALRERVLASPLEEGRFTAAGRAAAVKNNLQLNPTSSEAIECGQTLLKELLQHRGFRAAAMMAGSTAPMFSRYRPGMSYGRHIDAPIMAGGPGRQIRTDLAVTVFLAPPESYDGGELVIDTGAAKEVCKGAEGDCVVYPASYFHWIEAVRRGDRVVSFFWIQSLVRSVEQRRILFELDSVIDRLDREGDPQRVVLPLRSCHANLVRLASEP